MNRGSRGKGRSDSVAESLLKKVAAKEPGAVRALMDRYGGLVWSLARRFCRTRADAEDAVQEIFIDLWKSAGRYDETLASESTFITLIARRRLIDRRRKQGRQPTREALPEALPSEGKSELEEVEIADEAAYAAKALEKLRPEQRRVLELSIYQGLTHAQIAELTGMPLGTVKTHARRGLMKVRDLLFGSSPDQKSKKKESVQ